MQVCCRAAACQRRLCPFVFGILLECVSHSCDQLTQKSTLILLLEIVIITWAFVVAKAFELSLHCSVRCGMNFFIRKRSKPSTFQVNVGFDRIHSSIHRSHKKRSFRYCVLGRWSLPQCGHFCGRPVKDIALSVALRSTVPKFY